MTTRHREIQVQPQNGGKHCPSLMQKRGCQGTKCPHHVRNLMKETAMLLPIGLSWKRKINETADITRNLKYTYLNNDSIQDTKKEYCVKFEVMKSSKACRKENNFTALHDGATICVKCEEAAMRESRNEADARCPGHGVEGRTTRWEALSAPHCRGKWIRLESQFIDTESDENAICELCPKGSQFIFV
ncbi:UNVERIFIED_CONTAM: hypothetical protein PYX00_009604 [Menopon gallinae]|uniref:SBSPON-like C-terminal domain-containing protein n=1 Tax=Menopon gallinae TaxID=328185 RepID=A0AAW2HBY1_9NEOP